MITNMILMELLSDIWMTHAFIVLGSIALTQIAAALLRKMALKSGQNILKPLTSNSKLEMDGLARFSQLEESTIEKLKALFEIVNNRKDHHKKVFLKLYQFHFASVSLLLMLSVISGVVVFMVAQNGLNNADQYSKTIFYTLAALTTFYALSPIVYKQDITINKNLNNYIAYDNLQDEIYNFAITNLSIAADNEDFDKFHSRIMKKIAEKNSVDLDFDFKSIKTPDFFSVKDEKKKT